MTTSRVSASRMSIAACIPAGEVEIRTVDPQVNRDSRCFSSFIASRSTSTPLNGVSWPKNPSRLRSPLARRLSGAGRRKPAVVLGDDPLGGYPPGDVTVAKELARRDEEVDAVEMVLDESLSLRELLARCRGSTRGSASATQLAELLRCAFAPSDRPDDRSDESRGACR